jgi:hypothetical protein
VRFLFELRDSPKRGLLSVRLAALYPLQKMERSCYGKAEEGSAERQ